MSAEPIVRLLLFVALGAPFVPLGALSLAAVLRRPVSEPRVGLLVRSALLVTGACALAIALVMARAGLLAVTVDLGGWLQVPGHRVGVVLLIDRLSLPMFILSAVLCGVVGAFSHRYLHREPGFARFFLLFCVFSIGIELLMVAGSVGVLLAAWELVGVSSALLIAFFHERRSPVEAGLRAFVVYRVCDLGLILGVVGLHHAFGTESFAAIFAGAPWPAGGVRLAAGPATWLASFFLLAAMGKSAQVPFSGWLPRAMEGPTPSSAIFYGALSVHAGAFLLLRIAPLLDRAPAVAAAVVVVGALTAVHGSLAERVQTDIKCALAYASLTQVGVIFVEIGLGLRWLALGHIIGHVCVRTLQLLRSPSLLHDLHEMEASVGGSLPHEGAGWRARLSPGRRAAVYRFALERTGIDAWVTRGVVGPLLALVRGAERAERRWISWLAGRKET